MIKETEMTTTKIPASKVYIIFLEETGHGGWQWETSFHSVYATREKALEARRAYAAKMARIGRPRCEWKMSIRAVPLSS